MSAALRNDPVTVPKRNITLDDYDALADPTYRARIEDVVVRAVNSEHVQALLAPRGSIWPIDIFCAARDALERDPDVSTNSLYFSAVSTVLCRALASLRAPPAPPLMVSELTSGEQRAVRKRIAANVHRYPHHPLRVQVLRHMHLKWTIATGTSSRALKSGYSSDESEESVSDEDDSDFRTINVAC